MIAIEVTFATPRFEGEFLAPLLCSTLGYKESAFIPVCATIWTTNRGTLLCAFACTWWFWTCKLRGRGEERNSFNDANEKENVYKAYSLIVMIVCKWYDITRGQINTINHLVQGINNKIKGKLNKFVQTTIQLFNAIFYFLIFFFFYWCYVFPWNSTIDFHLIYLILQ